ncbi:ATP-binding cassette domain-containing protein [Fluviispira multicolorata]|uniref:ATP-binding cassette domain-containing protein n=1 Tax=Fluviispira multicolorata TaxID=2654512 RepID=A0A833N5H3_9BACT|nr:ATP-binding cassette domain-containing protein [Fluviispira multicolorata]KAB8033384.1 ATP-binding cassette domain-containing protein [Fluviispira multicolorata]
MSGFHKKNSWFVIVKDFIFSKNLDSPEVLFRKIENDKKTLWWLFFYSYRRQILFLSILQILFLSFILCFPLAIDFYLKFFLRSTSPIVQARLFSASLYLLSFVILFIFIIYFKNKYLLNWVRTIKYHSWYIMAKLCQESQKNSNHFLYKNFTEENEQKIIDKCIEFPKILTNLFSFPALIISYYFIYKTMGQSFFIPLFLLLIVFIFQFKNEFFLTKKFQKIYALSQFRSQLLKKIFTFGNRVRYLAMESFFLRKINLSQDYAHKITKNILNNIALSRVIIYTSGFIILIPSVVAFVVINKNASIASLTELVILFILVAHFYSNIIYLFSKSKTWKTNYNQFKSHISLAKQAQVKNVSNQEEWSEEFSNILINTKSKTHSAAQLIFNKASFFSSSGLCLYNLSFETKPGMLIAVVGQSGSGKSDLLSACAGELNLVSGEAIFSNNFEIISRNFQLFEGTLRENIILNREFDGRRYIETIRSCALEEEMNALVDGDETTVELLNEKFSVNFVKKVCLARTIYGKADYYFFDKPFHELSKEDASHIFNEALQKQLSSSIRIFATEKLEFASLCHHILVMKDGLIVEQGSHKTLVERSGTYARLYYSSADSRRFEFSQNYQGKRLQNTISPLIDTAVEDNRSREGHIGENKYFRSIFDSLKYFIKFYFKDRRALPSFGLALLSQLFLCTAFFVLFSEYFQERLTHIWQVSLFCSFSLLALTSFFYFHFKNATINMILGSSLEKKVYDVLIKDHKHDLAYTAHYLEEFSQVKEKLFANFTSLLVRSSFFIAGCFLLSITNLSALFLVIAMIAFISVFILFYKAKFFHAQVKIKSEFSLLFKSSKNYFELFTQAHSFSLRNFVLRKLKEKIEISQKISAEKDKIISLFIQFVSIFFCILIAISLAYFVAYYDTVSAGSVTLSVIATIFFFQAIFNISTELNSFMLCLPHFENLMRTSLLHEANEDLHYSTSEYWPQKGSLRIMSLTTQGTEEFPKYLRNLDLFIAHGKRFAIVEESDTNKISPFFASLLLFVPFQSGTVFLDDEDILRINPIELRNRFAYISLNSFFPFLSVRENLDPFEYFDDSEIWTVLNRVGIAQPVAILRNGLNSKIEEFPNQFIWSGELILLSFAKALLHANKVLLLDNLSIPEEIELRIIDLIEREFLDATILISTDSKSPLLQLCPDIIRIDNGEMVRISVDKNSYHIPIPYEEIENTRQH